MWNLSFTAALFSAIFVQKNLEENKHDFEGLWPFCHCFLHIICPIFTEVNMLTPVQLTRQAADTDVKEIEE